MNQLSIFNKLPVDKRLLFNICRGLAITSAVFTFVMCTLLITNYLQSCTIDPLQNPALEALIARAQENPDDAQLKAQIREIDLLSRKALFINQWQLRTGSYILLISVIILLLSLKTMANLRGELPRPEGQLDTDAHWLLTTKIRQGIAAVGLFLIGTAIIFAMLSYSELDDSRETVLAKTATAEDFVRNWANFRGPGGLGMSRSANAPLHWDIQSGRGIAWQSPVPKNGFNSPILWEDKIFLSGGDKTGLEIYCYARSNGELLWQTRVDDPADPILQKFRPGLDTGYAAPTMATNGHFVFAIFNTGLLVACDFSGHVIWKQNLGVPENHYGHASSLIVFENILIVQYDQSVDGRLLGLATGTGETVWRANRKIISWSSPALIEFNNKTELIVTNCIAVESFDPKTGVRNWQVNCIDGEHGPSPAFNGEILVVGNEYSQMTGLRLGSNPPENMWEYYDDLPDAVSPLATGDFVFLVASYGLVTCLDIHTGEPVWTHDYKKDVYASPVLCNGKIYLLGRDGTMHIFAVAGQFEQIADLPLGEKAVATPIIVDGKIYVRTEKSLLCLAD